MNPLIRSIIWLIESSVHCTMFDHRPYTKSRIPCPTNSIPVAIISHPAEITPTSACIAPLEMSVSASPAASQSPAISEAKSLTAPRITSSTPEMIVSM